MSNLPQWNLSDFYTSYKSKKIKNDITNLNNQVIEFSKKYKNKLKLLDNSSLVNSIKLYEKIEEKIFFIKSFSFLTHCTDQLNKDKNKFYQGIDEVLSKTEKNLVFFGIEFNKLDKKKVNLLKKI